MASRHQRRKTAAKRKENLVLGALQAQRAAEISSIVKSNRQHKPSNSVSYGTDSCVKVAMGRASGGNGVAQWGYDSKTATRIAKQTYGG